MDDTTMYPTDFTLTNAHEHDLNQLPVLVNQPEATYVFDRGYYDFEKMDQMHWDGYFFVTRIKKKHQSSRDRYSGNIARNRNSTRRAGSFRI